MPLQSIPSQIIHHIRIRNMIVNEDSTNLLYGAVLNLLIAMERARVEIKDKLTRLKRLSGAIIKIRDTAHTTSRQQPSHIRLTIL